MGRTQVPLAYPETEMNAEIADILCGDKRLADYFESFDRTGFRCITANVPLSFPVHWVICYLYESFDHCFSPDEMNALANLLANDVLRELNYRDLTISELPIEITFVLRWYIIRRINKPHQGTVGDRGGGTIPTAPLRGRLPQGLTPATG